MKAFVTSIGEKTTAVCCNQLIKLGFEVVLLDKKETWLEKYKDFIRQAEATGEDVLRVDADIILGNKAKVIPTIARVFDEAYMIQFQLFDFYRYGVYTGGPVLYKKAGLKEMVKKLDRLTEDYRPETKLSRLPEINNLLVSCPIIMGTHGFFQTEETMREAEANKIERGQISEFDFDLAFTLKNL